MLGRKDILPKPPLQQPPQPPQQVQPAPIIQDPLPQQPAITNEDIMQGIRELYTYLMQRIDALYYKIDQTQDLILLKAGNQERKEVSTAPSSPDKKKEK